MTFDMDEVYPLTVVLDRYGGTYSGGRFTARNLDFGEVPTAIASDDVSCYEFWLINQIHVGKGPTMDYAVADLISKINEV